MLANPYNTKGQFSDDTAAGSTKLDGITAQESDKGAFRTKNLRGCAQTAPYDHDGAFATLREVVDFYDKGGGDTPYMKDEKLKALSLTDEQKNDLVAFLEALTGAPPPAALGPP
jgi:cytochrome c peroxidase